MIMEKLKNFFLTQSNRRFVFVLTFMIGTISIIQSWVYIHTLETNLDEGAYLLKGYMFVTHRYIPYQLYGFWSNHMPLAFLIPGFIQKVFGPGLAVGRYFMIVVFIFTLIGLWITTQRLSGAWGACLALIIIALNPALIKMYSTAVSQGLTACVLTWVFVFSLGENRSTGELFIASILASILVLIRENLFPVPVFLILFVIWQYGWKKGILSLVAVILPIIFVHIIYWPNILQIYVRWIPRGMIPILDAWRIQHPAVGIWHPDLSLENRLISIFRTFRFHFILLMGSLVAITMQHKSLFRENRAKWRELFFMLTLFWALFFAHAWVTLSGDYCNYCLEGYVSFFAPLGIILVISTFPFWNKKYPSWSVVLLGLLVILLSAGIGIALIDDFRFGMLYIYLPRFLLKFPKLESGWFLPVEVLRNVFPTLSDRQTHVIDIVSTSIFIGISLIFVISVLWRLLTHNHPSAKQQTSFGYIFILSILVFGFVSSPTSILSGGRYTYDCNSNTLANYESIGKELANILPPNSLVFWKSMAATPLLYVPNIRIYPPQINDVYSFYIKGNDEELIKLGFWNEAIARQWLMQADYIIIEENYFNGFYKNILKNGKYQLITILPPQSACRENSRLRIYQPVR